jgi:hypothetical protein
MANPTIVDEAPEIMARPKYYEVYGAEIANGNRAWVLACASSLIAVIALVFAIIVRIQPPTVIGIPPNGDPTVLGRHAQYGQILTVAPGADEFQNRAFLKRFLSGYLNYDPSNVDERWHTSLNMMTRNLRKLTMDKMKADNIRQQIDDEQIQAVFHLREISPVPGEPLAYVVYGVKDVHHLKDATETTDHLVNEYRIRLKTDNRSELNPDGLWIAEYSERSIDGERREQVLEAPDQETTDQ